MKKREIVFSLFFAAAMLPPANAATTASRPVTPPFGETLNACLAQPGATVLDCVNEAGRRSESQRVIVEKHFDFSLGVPERDEVPPTADIVFECGDSFCDMYDCYEGDDSSTCDLVGFCTIGTEYCQVFP